MAIMQEINRELLEVINRLVNSGHVERKGNTLFLTNKGRTRAILRWQGLNDDLKVLIALWFREQLK